jgi:hypothetical protein
MIAPVDRLEIKIRAENEKRGCAPHPLSDLLVYRTVGRFPFPDFSGRRLETVRGD